MKQKVNTRIAKHMGSKLCFEPVRATVCCVTKPASRTAAVSWIRKDARTNSSSLMVLGCFEAKRSKRN